MTSAKTLISSSEVPGGQRWGNTTIYPTAESHWFYSAREWLIVLILTPLNSIATSGSELS